MRLTTVVVMVACLAGCAGNQSALPFPPTAPAFSSVEDAPITIGHPGYVAPEPERSPHARVLPETPETRREDGLWAVKPPSLPRTPVIVEIPIPLPVPDSDAPESLAVRACALMGDDSVTGLEAVGKAPIRKYIIGRPEAQRRCFAAKVLLSCMRSTQSARRSPSNMRKDRLTPELADAAVRHAKALVERWCEGIELDPTLAQTHRFLDASVFSRPETQ